MNWNTHITGRNEDVKKQPEMGEKYFELKTNLTLEFKLSKIVAEEIPVIKPDAETLCVL